MDKRRLFVTILIIVLVIALVIGGSYVLSTLLKNFGHNQVPTNSVARVQITKVMHGL